MLCSAGFVLRNVIEILLKHFSFQEVNVLNAPCTVAHCLGGPGVTVTWMERSQRIMKRTLNPSYGLLQLSRIVWVHASHVDNKAWPTYQSSFPRSTSAALSPNTAAIVVCTVHVRRRLLTKTACARLAPAGCFESPLLPRPRESLTLLKTDVLKQNTCSICSFVDVGAIVGHQATECVSVSSGN